MNAWMNEINFELIKKTIIHAIIHPFRRTVPPRTNFSLYLHSTIDKYREEHGFPKHKRNSQSI